MPGSTGSMSSVMNRLPASHSAAVIVDLPVPLLATKAMATPPIATALLCRQIKP